MVNEDTGSDPNSDPGSATYLGMVHLLYPWLSCVQNGHSRRTCCSNEA